MGLDDEQKKTEANGIRRVVEARREDPGGEPTAAQEKARKFVGDARRRKKGEKGRRSSWKKEGERKETDMRNMKMRGS